MQRMGSFQERAGLQGPSLHVITGAQEAGRKGFTGAGRGPRRGLGAGTAWGGRGDRCPPLCWGVSPSLSSEVILYPGAAGRLGANGWGPRSAREEGQLVGKCGLPGSGGSVLGRELHRLCPLARAPSAVPSRAPWDQQTYQTSQGPLWESAE